MYIDEFIWLEKIVDKLEVKHHVSQDEVEESFFNKARYRFVESGHQKVKTFIRQAGRRIRDDI